MEKQQLLRFGAFALKADESVLELEGKVVPLTPKMFDTLLVLVKNQGRIVEKETILREVWPDSFVEEGNIAFNIRQLRKALGDDAQSPSFIETVPKRGYKFIAKIDASDGSPGPPPCVRNEKPHVIRKRIRKPVALLGLAVIIVAAAVVPLLYRSDARAAREISLLDQPLSFEKLSTDGNIFHAVLSPDGRDLVYTHRNGSGKQSLWVRQIETSNSTQIIPPSDQFYGGLAVSPDGETVFFARGAQTGPQTDIYRMPIRGGVPEKMIDGTQGWISLSADGSRISFVRCPYAEEDYCSLYVADAADGKNVRKLATRPRPMRIADNQISPDGTKVAFAAGQSRTASNEFGLYEVDIETGVEKELTREKFFNIGYLAFLPDQSGILITAMQRPDHSYPVWRVSLPGGKIERLTTDSENYARLSLDKRANRLLATRVTPDFRLFVHDAKDPGSPPTAIANAVTVAFAPNGRLIFSSLMTGNAEIWSANADGSDQRQLTSDAAGDAAPLVSRDGHHIFFGSDRSGILQVWRMNMDGSDAKQLTAVEGGYPLVTSPDGKWLFYRSGLNGTIRKVDTHTGEELLVAPDLGRNMTMSPDAALIVFTRREAAGLILSVYSLADERVIRTFEIPPPNCNLVQMVWTADGKRLAYILTDDKRENGRLFFQDIANGRTFEAADLRGDAIAEMAALALSSDGRHFAVIKGNWKHDAVLIKGSK